MKVQGIRDVDHLHADLRGRHMQCDSAQLSSILNAACDLRRMPHKEALAAIGLTWDSQAPARQCAERLPRGFGASTASEMGQNIGLGALCMRRPGDAHQPLPVVFCSDETVLWKKFDVERINGESIVLGLPWNANPAENKMSDNISYQISWKLNEGRPTRRPRQVEIWKQRIDTMWSINKVNKTCNLAKPSKYRRRTHICHILIQTKTTISVFHDFGYILVLVCFIVHVCNFHMYNSHIVFIYLHVFSYIYIYVYICMYIEWILLFYWCRIAHDTIFGFTSVSCFHSCICYYHNPILHLQTRNVTSKGRRIELFFY